MKKNKVYTVWPFKNSPDFPYENSFLYRGGREFVEDILSDTEQSHYVYVAPEEFVLSAENNLRNSGYLEQLKDNIDRLKNENIDITVITGRYHQQPTNAFDSQDFITAMKEHIDVHYWHTYWMFSSIANYVNPRIEIVNNYPDCDITQAFTCLNGKPHFHRCYFIDLLAHNNLIDNNIVSWAIPTWSGDYNSYQWQYWNEQYLVHEQFVGGDAPQYPSTDPNGYYNTLIDVITETSNDVVFWTEKTVKPLVLQRPFIILGAQHTNTLLRDLGFELFDEFIDYDFDHQVDSVDRAHLIVEQLSNLNQRNDYNQLRQSISHKLKHNQQRILEIAVDPAQIPLRKMLSEHIEKYEMILKNNQEMMHQLSI